MDVKNDILDELLEMHSPLAGAPRVMPFPVPDRYFESFATNILSIVGNAAPQVQVYDLPDSYFEDLPAAIMATIRADEATASFPREYPYQVPAGYFAALPEQVVKTVKKEPAKTGGVVLPWERVIRWAAAAALVLGISLGSYKMLYKKPVDPQKALGSLPEGAIHDYVAQNVDDFDSELIFNSLGNDKVIKSVDNLEEQEIIQYLNENGWEGKAQVN
ncbi:MAG: hypothetical protein JSS82_01830 [Bacteroidetes bacterium]|nr:hypothetical protein [Bacteroidota bacterium]